MKKPPIINIVLILIIAGVLTAGVIGLVMYSDTVNPGNNFVKSTFNTSLSKHYTDSLSSTGLAELGSVEIEIYDSVENSNQAFVQCTFPNLTDTISLNEAKQKALTILLSTFPVEQWNGELTFRMTKALSVKSHTVQMHPIQFEIISEWSD